jgi:hypothetical protein
MSTKKGGKKDKMKKFARILDYLEVKQPALWEIIDDLAMHGALTPRRGGSITFLVPDSTYIKEIKKITESNDPESAVDIINSLVLTDLFEKTDDFAAKKDDIPTLLGTRLLIKSITPSKIMIEDGELAIDAAFKPFSRHGAAKRGNMAVWNLKGKVKYEGAPKTTFKYAPKPGDKKKGPIRGAGGDHCKDELQCIKSRIIKEKIEAMSSNKRGLDGGKYCPMLNAVTRLLRVYSNETDSSYHDEYRKARCILTINPVIDFYLLYFNPLVFSESRLLEAYKKGIDCGENVNTYKNLYQLHSHPAFQSDSAALMNEEGVKSVNAAREILRNDIIMNKNSAKKICDIYKKVDAENAIENISNVYPASLATIFKSNPGLHLLIDEFCHLTYCALMDITALPEDNYTAKANAMMDLTRLIYEAYGKLDNPAKKTRLNDPSSYGLNLDAGAIQQCIKTFWQTFGLHVTPSSDVYDMRIKVGSNESDEPYSNEMIDVDGYFNDCLDTFDNSPVNLSDSTLAEMRAYMNANAGKMPAELEM